METQKTRLLPRESGPCRCPLWEGCFFEQTHVACRYDTGPILAQAVVPVSPTDTPVKLAAKVLKEVRSAWHAGWNTHAVVPVAL